MKVNKDDLIYIWFVLLIGQPAAVSLENASLVITALSTTNLCKTTE